MIPDFRLTYHLMGEIGWINDPNGVVYFNGQYHVFYQHNPYASVWGPMHWGHAVSDDLISWRYLPVALAPDEDYDRDGCFSGSAIVRNGRLYLLYTGHVVDGPNMNSDYMQQQCLAVSDDGVVFEKYANNPVIGKRDIPSGANQKDFRDPKVVQFGDSYYLTIGSNDGNGLGQALLYQSDDLVHWSFKSVLAKSDGTKGTNWECPDLFQLGDQHVLVISPQNVDSKVYQNENTSLYLLGKFNADDGRLHDYTFGRVDYGFDFYAPQSMEAPDGRRILIGWMNTWHQENPTHTLGHGWVGAMTLPREVVQVGNELHFRPVREIEDCRQNEFVLNSVPLSGELVLETTGEQYELEVSVDLQSAQQFGIKVRVGTEEQTVLSYETAGSVVRLDRNQSGIGPKGVAQTTLELQQGLLYVRLFVDTSSVEVFLNNGEKVMTGLIYPSADSKGIRLFSEGQVTIQSLRKWDIAQDKRGAAHSLSHAKAPTHQA